MDAAIVRDIADWESSSTLPWMRRAVAIRQADNPYFIPQFQDLNTSDEVATNIVGKVFAERQNVMIIDFPETGKPEQTGAKSEIAQFLESKDFNLGLTEVNAAFDLESKSSRVPNRIPNMPPLTGYRKPFPVALEKFETGFELIEPMLCTGFLYSMRTNAIMSEMWNFYPKETESFLVQAGLEAQASTSVTFEMDPLSMQIGCVLVILLSRNAMKDRGEAMNAYYEQPSSMNRKAAQKVLETTFPRLCRMYQTFAFTFVDFGIIRTAEKEVMLPNAYLIDKTVGETDIRHMIIEACSGRFRQIPIKMWLSRPMYSQVTMRQISGGRPNPFFAPINQLYVKLDKLTPADPKASHGKELLVAVSVKDADDGAALPVLTSKFAPMIPSECEFSRCVADVTNPVFDESFVLNLPFPLPPRALLTFTIVRVDVEDESGASEELSTASIPLFQDELSDKRLLIIANNTYNLNVSNGDVLSIRTHLRSSLLQNNQSLVNFLRTPEVDFSKLMVIPSQFLIEYMFPILDKLVDGIHDCSKRGVEIFIDYSKLIINTFEYRQFTRFLLAFMKFYAFRIHSVGTIMAPAVFGIEEDRFSSPAVLIAPDFGHLHKYQSVDEMPIIDMCEFNQRTAKSNPSSRKGSMPSDVEGELADMNFPSRILWYLNVLLTKNDELIDRAAPMFDFFFSLIIKWLEIEKGSIPCDGILPKFCCAFSNKAMQLESSEVLMKSIAIFANLMFDIGRCSASLVIIREVIKVLRQKVEHAEVLMKFIESTFKPRFFLFMSRNSEEFRRIVVVLVSDAYTSLAKNQPLSRLFGLILQIVNLCGDSMKNSLANALIGLVEGFKPSQMVLCSKNLLIAPLVLFEFLTTKADDVPCNMGTINALHFMLKKIKEKDVAELMTESKPIEQMAIEQTTPQKTPTKGNRVRSGTFRLLSAKRVFQTPPTTQSRVMPLPLPKQREGDQKQQEKLNHLVQFTIHNVLTIIKRMATKPNVELRYLVGVLYHLLFVDESTEFNKTVLKTMEELVMKYKHLFFQVSSPCLIKIVKQVLHLVLTAHKMRQPAEEFITAFYRVDDEVHQNMNMSNVVMIRCFTLLTPNELKSNGIANLMKSMREKKAFALIASKYDQLVQEQTYIDIYARCDYFWFKFVLLSESPDAQCQVLEEMYQFHIDGGRDIEAATVSIMQAALVSEYLTQLGRLPNYFNKNHASTVFQRFCPMVNLIVEYKPKEANLPVLPGFCDSKYFSPGGLNVLLLRVLEIYKKKNLYDLAESFVDIIWPIQEYWHSYTELGCMFQSIGSFLTGAEMEMDTNDRYYKVKLHSTYEGKKEYIYRAKPLTSLQEFIEMMRDNYSKTYGEDRVDILSGSDTVDESKVERGGIVLQVTFVEPFQKGHQHGLRFPNKFYTQIPFVKGQKKAQGDVDQQWIRRYLYETNMALPNIFGRAEVISCTEKEYAPIQYAYKQLQKRYAETKDALDHQNIAKLCMILKGTVCPEVNSGPKRFIEVFLSSQERTKHTDKLVHAIELLVQQAKTALKVIAEDCTVNTSYVGLYEQLERGHQELMEAIRPHSR